MIFYELANDNCTTVPWNAIKAVKPDFRIDEPVSELSDLDSNWGTPKDPWGAKNFLEKNPSFTTEYEYRESLPPIQNPFNFKSNLSLKESGMNGLRILDSHYFQTLDRQIQDMRNMVYLEKQSFKFDDGIGYSDNIILQIGDRSYNTESYMGDIA